LVNRCIRKITPGGDVTLFAGSPTKVQGTNDGVGTAAKFQAPEGLAIDSADNLYVADQGASTIRKIAPDATVTTLAGLGKVSGTNDGAGVLARFNSPEDVAVDSDGNVYVADSGNDTIRRITPDGTVTTLAGNPNQSGTTDGTNSQALFSDTRGIAVDSAHNLYVADAVNNCRVRKITHLGPDWVVTTLAGGGAPFGAEYSVDAPGTNAVFKNIYGLTADSSGNVFAVDRGNDDIRKVTPDGGVTTFAGLARQTGSNDGSGGGAQFDIPEQVAVDNAGNIYVVEFGDNTVRKISPNGANWIVTTIAGCPYCPAGTNDGSGLAARFNGPFGLTVDHAGNVYVADTGNRTIRKITPSGTNWEVTTFAGTPAAGPIGDGTGTNAHFASPLGLAADATGLYVADSSTIRKITFAGDVTTLAGCIICGPGSADGLGTNALFWSARGVAVDRDGNLYVADQANDLVRKLTFNGSDWMVTTLGGVVGQATGKDGVGADARFNQPTGVAVDNAGNVYVVNSGENNIEKGVATNSVTTPLQFASGNGSLTFSNGFFHLNVSGPAGASVIIEASTNLQSWTPIQTNPLPLMLAVPGDFPNRFFRARLAP
jgi:sugar lactone lactonase YvrE